MNTATRAYAQPGLWSGPRLLPQHMLVVWLMMGFLLLSALGIVFVKDRYRRDYLQYQSMEKKVESMEVAHNRLLLESATRLAQNRLAVMAKKQGMMVPSDKKTIWLRAESH